MTKWFELEVFAGHKRFILCVPINVYIDGVFVKCYSKILDCNIDFYFLFLLILKGTGGLEEKKIVKEFCFVCFVFVKPYNTFLFFS